MNPTRTKPALPSRERRVWTMMWKMLAYALVISILVVVVSVLKNRTQGHTLSFLSGIVNGLLLVLPFGMALLLYRAYRQMDEFGQRLQEKACTFAFVMTMLAASAGYVFASSARLNVPLWALYLFGMAAYTIAVIRGSLAARGGRE